MLINPPSQETPVSWRNHVIFASMMMKIEMGKMKFLKNQEASLEKRVTEGFLIFIYKAPKQTSKIDRITVVNSYCTYESTTFLD